MINSLLNQTLRTVQPRKHLFLSNDSKEKPSFLASLQTSTLRLLKLADVNPLGFSQPQFLHLKIVGSTSESINGRITLKDFKSSR